MFLKYYKAFLLFTILLFPSLHAQNLKKVTIQLSWFDQFQFAGYYMAKRKGFYAKAGLDVEIKPFKFGIDIPKEVGLNNIDFAVGRETLILERAKNRKVVALYATFQATPLILLSTKESNINTINDFMHKNIMTTIDDAGEVSLKAMIRSNNVSLDDLTFLKHTHNINDLLNNKTDVISAYISKAPFELQNLGVEYNIFDPKKYGFDMYSDFLYTSEKLISKDINTVKAFKEASLKGWDYAYKNIEETSQFIFDKYNSQKLSKEELIYEGKELEKLSYFKTEELGKIDKSKVQRIYDLYNIMGLVSKKINLNEFVYSNNLEGKVKLTKKEKEYINKTKNINMCILPNAMPYSFMKNDEYIGVIADYIKLLEKKLKVKFTPIQTNTIVESLEFIKEGKCDFIPAAAISTERKKNLNFTSTYLKVPYGIVTKNNVAFINSLDDLKNKKIAMIKGYALKEELSIKYPKIDFIEVSNLNEGLEKVANSEVFAQIDTMATILYKVQKNYIDELKISGKLDEYNEVRVAVSKKEKILFSILDKAVTSVSNTEKNIILNKWVLIDYEKDYDYKFLIQILIFFLIVFIALLYRQNLLKKMNKELNLKVSQKTKELIRINSYLEDRVKKEVEENIKKDRILSRQSKMAAMGEMIENIAHQWRQPLSVITTGASGLKIKKQLNDLDDELLINTLTSIIDTSKYLSNTIDDFRYFFKPDKDKQTFSLNGAFDKTLNILDSKLKSENIVVVKDMQSVSILGFESELIQVFMNIINNAKDALEDTNINEKFIFVDIDSNEYKSVIKIKDSAGGIDANIVNKIFEPYFTTKHQSQGTGIGLYMCEQIINKYMNGTIEIVNRKYEYKGVSYRGAEFIITLNNQ